ncbi:hypothetical protein GCM10028824_43000 [Hymenobacter segetis]|uniref:Uncharacterized protein n=1 Tax=Hymenobacter segetis TaxID=2025509 RepID=A0ABU9LZJ8_9BACT
MKAYTLFRLSLLLLFSLLSTRAHAQPSVAPGLPGYWNTETNLTNRSYTIVRFYNGQDQLVYEERLNSLCLDLSRPRKSCTRRATRQLNLALQQVLRDPAASQNTVLLAKQFGTDRRVQRSYAVR